MAKNPRANNWSRLDNTGKMFPAVSGPSLSNVFRFSAQMTEPVEPQALYRALEKTLRAVPAFQVKMRRGLFWYYFEQNDAPPVVEEEREFPCSMVEPRTNGGYLFQVSYYGRRINLEVFHVLADGSGAAYFLEFLLYYYVQERYPEAAPRAYPAGLRASVREQQEDAFARYYTTQYPPESSSFDRETALPITGSPLPLGSQRVVEATMPTKALIAQAKAHGATVTEYLAAVLFQSIQRQYGGNNPRGCPVKVSIPVNLRSFFPSKTVKNFFMFVRLPIDFSRQSYTFGELVGEIRRQMAQEVTVPRLAARIRYQVELEQHWPARLVPRPLKNLGMWAAYKLAEKGYSCTFTNLGRVRLPEEVLPYVEQVGVMLGASRNNVFKVALISCGDRMVMTFNSTIRETDLQREVLTFLTGQGIPVTLRCNEV